MAFKFTPTDRTVAIYQRAAASAGRDAVKQVNSEARLRRAIGAASLDCLSDMEPKLRREFLFHLMVVAKAADRRVIARHDAVDDDLIARVETELAQREAAAKAAAEKAAAAKEAAAEKSSTPQEQDAA